ncbi:CoA-binding protein [Asanoa sp. NPDC050611]|uniref:CoA-binding protein n=1 Tax=Asanoa sp. NPDC050611 TaxID=3157098 RepID=UPI0033C5DD70
MRDAQQLLADAKVIAVVGASRDPRKPAHTVPLQLQRHGWRIIPVNPHADELFGERVYRSVAEIPFPIDLVNVFRPAPDAPDVVRDAIAAGAPAVWLQLDIVSDEARKLATEAGLDYVENRCTAVERAVGNLSKI